uniref:Uncharacterized protein n=1 Tax=Leersia perrieri TaxID=77586 RepID=A0A0D9WXB7_9ORYZ
MALVHYYPMIGCLREVSSSKLMVDSAAQGAVFIDATTDDVRLKDIGKPLVPPYPCAAELFCKEDMVSCHFLFGAGELAALRSLLSTNLTASTSNFELLTMTSSRCGTGALGYGLADTVRIYYSWNTCGVCRGGASALVPPGYYGNALLFPAVVATAGELCPGDVRQPLPHCGAGAAGKGEVDL